MSNIEQRICEEITKSLGLDREKVVPTANLVDDLRFDSLDKVELIIHLEEVFDINIDFDHERTSIDNCYTVQDIIDVVKPKIEATGLMKTDYL